MGLFAAAQETARNLFVMPGIRQRTFGALVALAAVCAFAGSVGAAPSGLVAAYSFDEGAGTTVADSSGNNNNGAVVAATWSTAGKFGKALSFSAAQHAYVSIPDSASLHLSALTLEAWVRPSSLTDGWRAVIFKERPGGMTYSLYANNAADRPVGQVYTSAEQNAAGSAQLPLNTWTHLAATFGGGMLTLYVNGVQASSVAVSGAVVASTGLLKIGGNAVWDEWFSGLIDDVRVYNRPLSAAEIQTDMNTAVPPDITPPTVQITSPANGAAISKTVQVTVDAQDGGGVSGVQFRLDGQDLGSEDTSAPYAASWDTTTAANGAHTLTAVARDAAGNRGTSASVGVSVQNTSGAPNFVTDTLVTGLDQPTQMVFAPGGRMLILERLGTVLVVQPGANQPDPTPFLQLDSVNRSDERGALGIVLDPAFATNGFFYVMYTHSSLVNRVSRFTAVGNVASPSSERVLWQNTVPAAIYHQGGGLAFGPDGFLYVSVGDNLTRDAAQDLSSYNGKILRIRSDGTVPTDNPFFDGSGPNLDAIWALGLRNPFRFTFDTVGGRMLIGDVGEGSWEEVDVGVKGANYGWPTCEGTCGVTGFTDPLYTYSHNGRDASITGGFVYRGGGFGAGFDGSYFFGDYAQNTIRRLTFDAGGAVSANLPFVPANGAVDGPSGDPVNLLEGPDGSLYYVDIGPLDVPNSGTIRRVRNLNGNNLPPTVSASAAPTSGAAPLAVAFSSAGTSDPEGAQLSYAWTFGDGGSSTAANPSHTYSAGGVYTARLSVSDGTNTAFSSPIQITAGAPPVPKITAPVDGTTFQAGQQINLAGSATDPHDGTLSGSSLSWVVVFHHETHQHPGPGPFTGGTASFVTPTSGHDFTGNTSYEIVLTATNAAGISASTSVFIYPQKRSITFTSSTPGLTLVVDSIPQTTPYTFDSLVGFHHTVDAPSPQSLSGLNYTFASWSDGGAKTHDVIVPSTDSTVTASFSISRPGVVAAYGFDEGSGSSVTDASGMGNTGAITNATWTSAGKNGGALSFNGTNAFVTVASAPSLDLTTGLTLEAWVNPSATGTTWRTVIFKERPGGMLYALYANNSSVSHPLGQVYLGGAEQSAIGPSTLPLNTWTHLAATYDGSALRLYVNGALTSTLAVSGTLAKTTNPLRIGGNSIWDEYFRGLIDDVKVYNRALSSSEIGSDMTIPVG